MINLHKYLLLENIFIKISSFQSTCSDGSSGWGRKRRAADEDPEEDTGFEDIAVGSAISITADEVVIEGTVKLNTGVWVGLRL